MGFIDRSLAKIGLARAGQAAAAPSSSARAMSRSGVPLTAARRPERWQRRSMQAGVTDRLTSSWSTVDTTLNQNLYRYLRPTRARSRDFIANNEYGRKFVNLCVSNIVGAAGFSLTVNALRANGQRDEQDSAKLERAFARWSKRGNCEVTGRLTFRQVQRLLVRMVARDGEVLVRKVRGADQGIHGFRLQILPAHLLDEQQVADLANGNRIRMGVEFDAWDKPVAYHIRIASKAAEVNGYTPHGRTERIPADEIYHLFTPEDAGQWRGYPWAAPSMRGARHLDQFEEAAVVAANIGASKMGFFKSTSGDLGEVADEVEAGTGEFISTAEPGVFGQLPEGWDFQAFDPAYPHEVFGPFVKQCLRKLSSGLGVGYHKVGNDLEGISFSSIRSGELDERESWKDLQGWFVDDLLEPLFPDWLTTALVRDPELKSLPYSRFDKFNAAVWQGRRWEWVDPKSDLLANRGAVELKIKSRAAIIRERGEDPERVFREIEAEDKRFGPVAPAPTAAAGKPKEPAAPGEDVDDVEDEENPE